MADTCKWMADNEICCNDKCPMCADFCPVPYEPGVCRYEDRDGAEKALEGMNNDHRID